MQGDNEKMKTIKRLLSIVIVFILAIGITNSQTDFFLNISNYFPSLVQYPMITKMSEDFSIFLSGFTDQIPSLSQIGSYITGKELPIDPEDVATNAYISDSPMLSFYPKENISVRLSEDHTSVEVFGITQSSNKKHLVLTFDINGESLEQISIDTMTDGTFNKSIDIPQTDSQMMDISIYNGPKAYGDFTSWVYNVLSIEKDTQGMWQITKSPVYEHNKSLYEKDRSISAALKSTPSIQKDRDSIISIATQLTEGIESDYDKALALHDWVCSYMYFDVDNLNSEETRPYHADEIIQNQRAVCLGFATLYAALCRSIDIPCNVVSGYALGVGEVTEWTDAIINSPDEQNHAWNEVYLDNRWVIVDPTWDTNNKIENGEKIKGNEVSHLYFDANLEFFSLTHKIVEYDQRR